MNKRFDLGYFVSEGFHSIFAHGLMSFAAVCMIVACLIIMGSFSLVALNVGNMLGRLEKENEFFAFVEESCTDDQIKTLRSRLEQLPNVASVTFTSKDQAREDFAARYEGTDDAELFENLPNEVYRDRFGIHVVDISQFADTVKAVSALPNVANVRAESEVANGFVVVSNIASGVAIILAVILVVVSLFIISNTIKLGTFTRREEIAIMKMCGATNGFIRWPFIFEGLLLGIAGAVLAFLFQWGVYSIIANAVTTSDTIKLIQIMPFKQVAARVLGAFTGAGLLVGVGGSVMAIRKFLQV
ncbi:Cell division protein FtsX [uncultured Eubacteriales bacterium]|uniref:Cell division protein FtsX n=1 Tax=uncultured Eubacteriales bacterium TaxID=172733 RepID=A0A212K5R0_9FIRM|nr:Cell division protein FtsX [uncultured Eubacteriales bacterium]